MMPNDVMSDSDFLSELAKMAGEPEKPKVARLYKIKYKKENGPYANQLFAYVQGENVVEAMNKLKVCDFIERITEIQLVTDGEFIY